MLRISKLAAVMSVLVLGIGCDRNRDPNRERTTTEQAPEIRERNRDDKSATEKRDRETAQALMSAKDDYRKKLNDTLAEIDRHVNDLKAKKAQNPKERQTNQDRMNNLTKRKELLQNDLRLIDSATKENWSDLKDQVDDDIKQTREAFDTGKT